MNPKPQGAGPRRIDHLTVMNIVFSGSFGLVGLGGLIFAVLGGGFVAWIIGGSFLLAAIMSGWLMLTVNRIQRRAFAEFGSALRSSLPPAEDESLRDTGDEGRAGDHCPVRYDPTDRSRLLATGPFVNGPVPDSPPVWGSPVT